MKIFSKKVKYASFGVWTTDQVLFKLQQTGIVASYASSSELMCESDERIKVAELG